MSCTGPMARGRRHGRPADALPRALLALALAILVAGCGVSTTRVAISPTATATARVTTSPPRKPLPTPMVMPSPPAFDCPDPAQPAVKPGATLTIAPQSGPVGTTIQLVASGLQPGCNLFVGLRLEPCLCETNNVPFPAPDFTGGAVQWVTVDVSGSLHASIELCSTMYWFPAGYRPSPCVMAYPELGTNYAAFGLAPGEYFYLTLGGATIPTPPPLFAKFSVTG